jgi:hypothetical protein
MTRILHRQTGGSPPLTADRIGEIVDRLGNAIDDALA